MNSYDLGLPVALRHLSAPSSPGTVEEGVLVPSCSLMSRTRRGVPERAPVLPSLPGDPGHLDDLLSLEESHPTPQSPRLYSE